MNDTNTPWNAEKLRFVDREALFLEKGRQLKISIILLIVLSVLLDIFLNGFHSISWIAGPFFYGLFLAVFMGFSRRELIVDHASLCFKQIGLGRTLVKDWHRSFQDILSIEFQEIPAAFVQRSAQNGLDTLVWRIHFSNGEVKLVAPSRWVLAPAESSVGATPVDDLPRVSKGVSHEAFQEAYFKLPLVQALRARGVPIPEVPVTYFSSNEHDMNAFPVIRYGLVLGLGGVMLSFSMLLMKDRHLVFDNALSVGLLVGSFVGILFAWLARRARPLPPAIFIFVTAVIVGIGVGGSCLPATIVLNGAGLSGETYPFVVHDKQLVPVAREPGLPQIPLPGEYSRWSFLAEGTRVDMRLTKGRLGLWEYDTSSLRDAARAQNIR